MFVTLIVLTIIAQSPVGKFVEAYVKARFCV